MGGYLDSTGLYHFGERYYDPSNGRFLQVDSVTGGSCNAYEYGCGDPINNRDLEGTAVWYVACSGHVNCGDRPGWVVKGIGVGKTPAQAKANCKKSLDAQAPRGCYIRHVQYGVADHTKPKKASSVILSPVVFGGMPVILMPTQDSRIASGNAIMNTGCRPGAALI